VSKSPTVTEIGTEDAAIVDATATEIATAATIVTVTEIVVTMVVHRSTTWPRVRWRMRWPRYSRPSTAVAGRSACRSWRISPSAAVG
jgi:hypothetical protein